jgi:propanediol dehydratase small subunit
MAIIALFLVAALTFLVALPTLIRAERSRRTALQKYWSRQCSGRIWKRTFPAVPVSKLRKYLLLFVSGFGIPDRRALQFLPTDSIYTIYCALYPIRGWPDSLELETFDRLLERHYGIGLRAHWREDLTLGEVLVLAQQDST